MRRSSNQWYLQHFNHSTDTIRSRLVSTSISIPDVAVSAESAVWHHQKSSAYNLQQCSRKQSADTQGGNKIQQQIEWIQQQQKSNGVWHFREEDLRLWMQKLIKGKYKYFWQLYVLCVIHSSR